MPNSRDNGTTHGISVVKENEWVLDNLGDLYRDQGQLDNAKAMYERALQGYEKALGPEHTSTLDIINNLGNLPGPGPAR
ncbi:uncharacterized protein DNG_05120 [Cephalotrichum gorgonifer]|uniref:Kinesin light chain n=1 Tax=Cephalotrichum gorgonifer TaxID=2041049 RepID=A0AAE8SVZ8_9PEZI|nr:uncharacterized protein DNG_05120 [Cephalotrichum gorgonifer]